MFNDVKQSPQEASRIGMLLRKTGLGLILMTAAAAQSFAAELPDFHALVQEYGPAVVNIRTVGATPVRRDFNLPEDIPEPFRKFFKDLPEFGLPPGAKPQAQGSGFVISEDGYVLTNAHVVAGAKEVTVRLNDRREFPAKVIGSDQRTDIALLKIDASHLPTVKLGDSDKLRVGDWVLAIGSPFGLDHTATQGIVSALSRNLPDENYVPFIQTDAAVNPGNSGGPLFDSDGEVIGINSQIYSRSGGYMGLSFAIPINVAMNTVEQLKTKGHVDRGWLGVTIQDMDQKLADSFGLDKPKGALVANVNPDSPAAEAGLKAGDVILSYDGKPIDRSGLLPPMVGATPSGSKVPVEILRNGHAETVTVKIGRLQEKPETLAGNSDQNTDKAALGLAVSDLDKQQRQSLGLKDQGVLVNGMQPDSPAEDAGFQPNDVILSFDHEQVKSVAQLRDLVKQVPAGKTVPVLVKRDQGTMFLAVTIPTEGVG